MIPRTTEEQFHFDLTFDLTEDAEDKESGQHAADLSSNIPGADSFEMGAFEGENDNVL